MLHYYYNYVNKNIISLFLKILESGDSLPSIPPVSSPSSEEELPTIKFPLPPRKCK